MEEKTRTTSDIFLFVDMSEEARCFTVMNFFFEDNIFILKKNMLFSFSQSTEERTDTSQESFNRARRRRTSTSAGSVLDLKSFTSNSSSEDMSGSPSEPRQSSRFFKFIGNKKQIPTSRTSESLSSLSTKELQPSQEKLRNVRGSERFLDKRNTKEDLIVDDKKRSSTLQMEASKLGNGSNTVKLKNVREREPSPPPSPNSKPKLNKSLSFYERVKMKISSPKKMLAKSCVDFESNYGTHLSYKAGEWIAFCDQEKNELWNAINSKKQRGLVDIRSFEDTQNHLHRKEDYFERLEQLIWDPKFDVIQCLTSILPDDKKQTIIESIITLSEERGCTLSLLQTIIPNLISATPQKSVEDIRCSLSVFVKCFAKIVAKEQLTYIISPLAKMIFKSEDGAYNLYTEVSKDKKLKKIRENMSKLVKSLLQKVEDCTKTFPSSFSILFDALCSKIWESLSAEQQKQFDRTHIANVFLVRDVICYMMRNPSSLDFISPEELEKVKEPLEYLAKIFEAIAFGTEFTEPHFSVFNNLVSRNKLKLRKFVDNVTVSKFNFPQKKKRKKN